MEIVCVYKTCQQFSQHPQYNNNNNNNSTYITHRHGCGGCWSWLLGVVLLLHVLLLLQVCFCVCILCFCVRILTIDCVLHVVCPNVYNCTISHTHKPPDSPINHPPQHPHTTPLHTGLVVTTIALLPRRLWQPQLKRMLWICGFVLVATALSADGVPPPLQPRAPEASLSASLTGLQAPPAPEGGYQYVLLHVGLFTVTRRAVCCCWLCIGVVVCCVLWR